MKVTFIHPDLGIGGAERLILDAALVLQSRGHKVTIYTSHRDPGHCFEEARDGTLDVRVRGNTVFPSHVAGRLHVLMAVLRQVHLTWELLGEKREVAEGKRLAKRPDSSRDGEDVDSEDEDDVFIVDQVPACVPILKYFGSRILGTDTFSPKQNRLRTQRRRILFYCHFPDQLLARRNDGNGILRVIKGLYRCPFDWFEGWAMSASDKVLANSKFTRSVVKEVFGNKLGQVPVVYPCVETESDKQGQEEADKSAETSGGEGQDEALWDGLKILLSINRFERKKNIELAIRAYHGLGDSRRKGTRLVIAGGYDNRIQENVQYHVYLNDLALGLGLQTATYKTVISALCIPDTIDVLFLLSVPSAFKRTLLRAATLLIYTPSQEHFGIVPVEAMDAGLPVLAANTGGPLETILDGKTGWLRDPNNVDQWTGVMRKALWEMSKDDIVSMKKHGRLRVSERFSRRAMGDRLEEEIENMLAAEPRQFVDASQILWSIAIAGVGISLFVGMVLKGISMYAS